MTRRGAYINSRMEKYFSLGLSYLRKYVAFQDLPFPIYRNFQSFLNSMLKSSTEILVIYIVSDRSIHNHFKLRLQTNYPPRKNSIISKNHCHSHTHRTSDLITCFWPLTILMANKFRLRLNDSVERKKWELRGAGILGQLKITYYSHQ